jgi:hypothetical protein
MTGWHVRCSAALGGCAILASNRLAVSESSQLVALVLRCMLPPCICTAGAFCSGTLCLFCIVGHVTSRNLDCQLRKRNAQILADLSAQDIADFRVPRHCRTLRIRRVTPHHECRPPSRTNSQPFCRRWARNALRFTPESELPQTRQLQPGERRNDSFPGLQ